MDFMHKNFFTISFRRLRNLNHQCCNTNPNTNKLDTIAAKNLLFNGAQTVVNTGRIIEIKALTGNFLPVIFNDKELFMPYGNLKDCIPVDASAINQKGSIANGISVFIILTNGKPH